MSTFWEAFVSHSYRKLSNVSYQMHGLHAIPLHLLIQYAACQKAVYWLKTHVIYPQALPPQSIGTSNPNSKGRGINSTILRQGLYLAVSFFFSIVHVTQEALCHGVYCRGTDLVYHSKQATPLSALGSFSFSSCPLGFLCIHQTSL